MTNKYFKTSMWKAKYLAAKYLPRMIIWRCLKELQTSRQLIKIIAIIYSTIWRRIQISKDKLKQFYGNKAIKQADNLSSLFFRWYLLNRITKTSRKPWNYSKPVYTNLQPSKWMDSYKLTTSWNRKKWRRESWTYGLRKKTKIAINTKKTRK